MSLLSDRETAYEYLNQIGVLNEAINAKIDERNDLILMCTTTGSFDYSAERVQCSPPLEARFTITMEKYMELEQKINEEIDEYVDLKNRIQSEINQLHNHEQIRILKYVFIQMRSLPEVLKIKNWKYKTAKTYNLYNDALDAFYETVLKPRKII